MKTPKEFMKALDDQAAARIEKEMALDKAARKAFDEAMDSAIEAEDSVFMVYHELTDNVVAELRNMGYTVESKIYGLGYQGWIISVGDDEDDE